MASADIMAAYDRSEAKHNYDSHSILHRCFPPREPKCLICHREGDELHQHPCLFAEDFHGSR